MATDHLTRIRRVCLAFPEVTERPSHGSPAFFVKDKTAFLYAMLDGHHDNEFPHLWCAAPPRGQEALIATAPERFFRPPYVGHRGWVGIRLDRRADWVEIAELAEEGYRLVAPKKLIAALDAARLDASAG
jgi:hypothetical protein